ncbi:MAG: hypothetical protein IJG87_01385 [Ruminococcus sp.]|nr:hypothetical protein [Ruminococcus sp.]
MMKLSGASNDFFYCFMRDEASFSLKYSVTFGDEIQRALLERAANEAMRLFPEFAVRPVIRNNKLEMTPNDSPLVFCEEPGPVKFYGSDDMNGYMLYFVCDDRKLSVYFNHGFTDAVGMKAYLSSVLTLYAAYIGKAVTDEAFLAGVRTPGHARLNPDPEDMVDPYRLYGNTESVPEYSFDNPGAFTIPMEQFPPETNEIHEYLVDISTSDFIRLTKKLGASFTPLMIDLAAQAVYRHYHTGEDPFIAMLPVNLRPFFGSSTLVNFSDGISVPTYRETVEPDISVRCTRMKNIMTQQMTKAAFERLIGTKAAMVDRFYADDSDIRTRKLPPPAGGKKPYTLPISYPGRLTLGEEIDSLLDGAFLTGYSRVNSIVAHTFRDKMEFAFIWRSEDISYINYFCDELRRCGFSPILTDNGLVKRDLFSLSRVAPA